MRMLEIIAPRLRTVPAAPPAIAPAPTRTVAPPPIPPAPAFAAGLAAFTPATPPLTAAGLRRRAIAAAPAPARSTAPLGVRSIFTRVGPFRTPGRGFV